MLLHQICHNEIHARFTEAELAQSFHTIKALLSDPHIAKFAVWIAKRPPTFHAKTPGPRRKRV